MAATPEKQVGAEPQAAPTPRRLLQTQASPAKAPARRWSPVAVGLPSVLSMAEDSSSIIAIVVVAMRLVYRMLAKHEMAT